MRYWWVNQNQTYRHEVQGGFLWSPKTKKDGSRNPFYDFMREVRSGDLIFSFADTRIKAIGVALQKAETASKPEFGSAGDAWANEGWFIPVEFRELPNPIRPKDHIDQLRGALPEKYSPLNEQGDGSQSVYLTSVPDDLAERLLKIIGPAGQAIVRGSAGDLSQQSDEDEEQNIRGRTDIGSTTNSQLVQARRGQGIFKANVRLHETRCRVTGVSDERLLIASHIKPWCKSNDLEKLDGNNGLLLSPHVDRLFDRGIISFSDDGHVLVSKTLPAAILVAWGIDGKCSVGSFNPHQRKYLAYHRRQFGFEK